MSSSNTASTSNVSASVPRERPAVDPYKPFPTRNSKVVLSSSAPFTPTYVQSRLKHSDPAGVYASRIHGRHLLLENPPRESKAKKEREEAKKRRQERKAEKALGLIGKKEAKSKGVWKLDPAQAKFNLFLPLHQLWQEYMSELLALPQPPSTSDPSTAASSTSHPNSTSMHPKLVKADYHGALVTVVDSKNPALVGLSGIVVHESENAFRVVTRKDQFKLLPKQNAIYTFAVPLYSLLTPNITPAATITHPSPLPVASFLTTVLDRPHLLFTLYGNQFCFRAAERAGRKFKHKESIAL